jgi:hypothetical protein
MALIVDLLQETAQKIRRAPEPTLVTAYREAARKLCLESRWLRRNAEPILTEADDNQYLLTLSSVDAGLEIISVRTIIADNQQGTPQSSWRMGPSDPTTWNPSVQPGAPWTYAYVPEAEVALFPTPDGEYELATVVCVQPTIDAEEIPDDLVRKHNRAMTIGALAYLYGIPGQAWSDAQSALVNARAFQAAINNATADVQRGYQMGTVMARIPRVF